VSIILNPQFKKELLNLFELRSAVAHSGAVYDPTDL
jgi:hypothetical protein